MKKESNGKSLESWIWDAACSIRGAKDAPKYKDYILPLIFTKRLCDVFDDELNRIAKEVGSRAKAFSLVKHDKKLVRFYLPLEPKNPDEPVWSVIRTGNDKKRKPDDKYQEKLGQELTTYLRAIADAKAEAARKRSDKSQAADPRAIARIQDAADQKIKKAADDWEIERSKLNSKINRLEGALAEAIAFRSASSVCA